jgi:hypothetical protein
MSRRPFFAILAAVALPALAQAQGSIAAQGFGYPTGQLTARALATGGSLGEFDPAAPLNPAAVANWLVMGAYAQYAPERRTSDVGTTRVTTLLPRFPVFAVGLPISPKWTIGFSTSSLLERNYFTSTAGRQLVRDDSVTVRTTSRVQGNMSDLRVAIAYSPGTWLRVGAAYHVVGGENRSEVRRVFEIGSGSTVDTTTLQPVGERSELGFSGRAVSLGVDVRPLPALYLAASVRRGAALESRVGRTIASRADVPNRLGLAARYEGLPGVRLAARWEQVDWSAMQGLGSGVARAFDTREWGAGIEVNGPAIQRAPTDLRLGIRRRTLPWGVGGVQPEERAITGGIALPFARGRYILDIGIERADRSVPGLAGVAEQAWTTAVGVRVRP